MSLQSITSVAHYSPNMQQESSGTFDNITSGLTVFYVFQFHKKKIIYSALKNYTGKKGLCLKPNLAGEGWDIKYWTSGTGTRESKAADERREKNPSNMRSQDSAAACNGEKTRFCSIQSVFQFMSVSVDPVVFTFKGRTKRP